jgi:hypothetical protein
MPPQVKCTITNEFHYYDDECNCEEAMIRSKEVKDKVKDYAKIISEHSSPTVINQGSLNATPSSFSGVWAEEISSAASIAYGATSCLVCGEDILLED